MKKVVIVISLLICTSSIFSQLESVVKAKKTSFGFNIGVNTSKSIYNNSLPNNPSIRNQAGFKLGLLISQKLTKSISIAPKSELSFSNGKIDFNNIDNKQETYQIMPVSFEFMTHIIFKKNNDKSNPYFFLGPNVKFPFDKKEDNSLNYTTNTDFAIDFGIGLEQSLANFKFSPELRYSYGLLDINQHPDLNSLNLHRISLVLNFIG